MMLYKFPMPTRANGVGLFALPNQQLGIEVGRPRDGKMAYDAELATGRPVTIQRPDIDKIIADAVRQVDAQDAGMPIAGKPRLGTNEVKADTMEYDDDASKVIDNLLSYLEKYLDPEQMDGVKLILGSGDAPDNDAGEPRERQATDRRRAARLAADAARHRPMSRSSEDAYSQMFPHAHRLG